MTDDSGSGGSIGKVTTVFERMVVLALQILLLLILTLAMVELAILLYQAIVLRLTDAGGVLAVDSVSDLQRAIQRGFAGILLIILGLELLDTLRTYFTEHRLRLEIILIVAIIALGRHIIVLDLEHVTGDVLLGVAALTLAVTGGYFLVRKAASLKQ